MPICTFFGHHDCPYRIRPLLRNTIQELIEFHGVDCFYVGNHGAFDQLVRSCLRELSQEYPQIRYSVVLAYLPSKQNTSDSLHFYDTLLPEGIESVPPRFAISWRNRWMLKRADFVITYITHDWGNTAKYVLSAKKAGKQVIHLTACENPFPDDEGT